MSIAGFGRGFIALAGLSGLGILVVVPLEWKEQAILGAVLIAWAVLLNSWHSQAITVLLMAISSFSTLRYACWRVTQTWEGVTSFGHLHRWDTVFVLLLLFAELYAFTTLLLGYFQTLRPLRRTPLPLPDDSDHWPLVDVFIPTYNEPLSVVRATVLASLALDYPAGKAKIFILDDGRRPEFRDFAAAVGATYIARSNNAHAKAGNINHALAHTSGEYVAIFDSDHVPTRSFLQMTLGWFLRDRRLGMVQTPHHFYSPDPLERNLALFRKVPNEGELFHRLIQDGNDLWNASFFCGSCAVLRRAALKEIGGIAVETVTEDAHTALRMQRRGWNTAYVNLPLAAGLATETLAAHIGQRIRWARGMIQILRLENPLFTTGLTLPQRLCYFNATTHFLFALPRLIFLTVPLVYLLLGMVNIYGYSLAILAYAFPHIVLSNLTASRIQGRHRFSFWNEIYEAVLAPYILLPTLLALVHPRFGKFNVTAKGGIVRRSHFHRRIALPFLFLLALNVAALYKARQRYIHEPAHHDTVIMNCAWTIYNVLILSVAASAAWERRQRRVQVRVDVRTPCTLSVEHRSPLMGLASQLSLSGASVRLERALRLPKGTRVSLLLDNGESTCVVPALVVRSVRRRQHLVFNGLTPAQEKYLVNLIYSRPDAWLSWHDSRKSDNPLTSLLHIAWLGLRGMCLLPLGLIGLLPTRDHRPQTTMREERGPALAASIVLAVLMLTPARLEAGPGKVEGQDSPAPHALEFNEEFEIASPTASSGLALRGSGASQNVYFAVPVTKIIRGATLKLRYMAPMLLPNEARLELTLNDTVAGNVTLIPGLNQETDVALPTDLLTNDNTLSLQVVGRCARCGRGVPWVAISPASILLLNGTKLPLANDLALLPLPFFDPAGQRPWNLQVVFANRPDPNSLEAASIVASWFGVLSDVRGVQFPVKVGDWPEGNALILGLRSSQLVASLSLPSKPGAVLAIRDNPRDPYGKLLVLAGDRTEDLLSAARALVTRNNRQTHIDVAYVTDPAVPARIQNDAPRWIQAGQLAPIGAYTTAEHLELRGSGSINIYFRLPPDLFLRARQSVPLLLKYAYAGVVPGLNAALHVHLNDKDIGSIPLDPAATRVEKADLIRLPTSRLQPYTNTLTVDFDLGRNTHRDSALQFAAIRRDSSLDLRGLPHSVLLPQLELFVAAGYPYTEWPDLSRTAVILPATPTATDYELLLDMAGFFGSQTGYPGIKLSVLDPADAATAADKDLVLLGTPESQPLLSQWANSMPLAISKDGMWINRAPPAFRLLNLDREFRDEDRSKLEKLASSGTSLGLIVEGFVSPLLQDRSVVAIVPAAPINQDAVASLFIPAVRQGSVYGGVAVWRDGKFQSFLVMVGAYHSGDPGSYQRLVIFLVEHYWLIPLIVLLLALFITVWLRRSVERVASRRLAPGNAAERSFVI